MAKRLKAAGYVTYRNGFRVTLHEHLLELPLRWRRPRMIFVNSMSDLFHSDVPASFIGRAVEVMREASRHRFQILTKRSGRLVALAARIDWPPNVWMGVTVESADHVHRIDHLRATGAVVKFLSLEPLLTPMPDLNLAGIDWVIVGGESGPGARPMRQEWVTAVRDQCVASAVPFFFKQWGGLSKRRSGRVLEGRTWDEMPAAAVVVPT